MREAVEGGEGDAAGVNDALEEGVKGSVKEGRAVYVKVGEGVVDPQGVDEAEGDRDA